MSTIVLMRPGCTEFDVESRLQGTLDIPHNERGKEQVARLLSEVQTMNIEIIFSSPCEPARGTAELLRQELGVPLKELEGLQNLSFGLWQGLNVDDLKRKHPRVYKQWQESPQSVCPPEGETLDEVESRVQGVLERPIRKEIPCGILVPDPLFTLIASMFEGTPFEFPSLGSENIPAKLWKKYDSARVKEVFQSRFGGGASSPELVIPRLEK